MLRLILQLVGLVHNDLCGETEWEMFYDSEAAEVAMKLLLAALKHCSF